MTPTDQPAEALRQIVRRWVPTKRSKSVYAEEDRALVASALARYDAEREVLEAERKLIDDIVWLHHEGHHFGHRNMASASVVKLLAARKAKEAKP